MLCTMNGVYTHMTKNTHSIHQILVDLLDRLTSLQNIHITIYWGLCATPFLNSNIICDICLVVAP